MEHTKEQIVEQAVAEVRELNKIFDGLWLNGETCLPKWHKNAMKKPFLAGATALIFGANREQLEKAYDELDAAGVEVTVSDMFRLIGNMAPNPDNEEPIHTVEFGPV